MRISRIKAAVSAASLAAVAALAGQHGASAQSSSSLREYDVVITNLMNGEPMSGPVLATHRRPGEVFDVGAPASYGVVQVAENGNNEPLYKQLSYLQTTGQVADVADYRLVAGTYPGAVPVSASGLASSARFPSTTQRIPITAPAGMRLSWVSMLVCTNDGFTGGDGLVLPSRVGKPVTYQAYAYQTSTETDNQLLANIMTPCQALTGRHPADGAPGQGVSTTAAFPGPGTFPDPATADSAAQYPGTVEGGVIVPHPGIQAGVGDLGRTTGATPSNYDLFRWDTTRPVASVTIERTR